MLLRNTEHFRDVLELSVSNQQHRRFTLEEGQVEKINGFFVQRNNTTYGLCANDGAIWILCGGELLECTEGVSTQVESKNETGRTFFVLKNGEEIVRLSYKPEKPHWNFFAMEDEDVDGLLLIHNILSSPERKGVFLEANIG